MSYNETDVWNAFDTLLVAMPRVGQVYVSDQIINPMLGQPYCRGWMSRVARTPMGFGANCPIQYDGTYQVNVFSPFSSGRVVGSQIAGRIEAAFPRGLYIAVGTNQSVSVMLSQIMPAVEATDWITLPVVIQWMGSDP